MEQIIGGLILAGGAALALKALQIISNLGKPRGRTDRGDRGKTFNYNGIPHNPQGYTAEQEAIAYAGMCIPSRTDFLTGAYGQGQQTDTQGDYVQARQPSAYPVMIPGGEMPRLGTAGMTAPTHNEQWDYPVSASDLYPAEAPIAVDNWPVEVRR